MPWVSGGGGSTGIGISDGRAAGVAAGVGTGMYGSDGGGVVSTTRRCSRLPRGQGSSFCTVTAPSAAVQR
ncbi:hypothetical protein ACKVMH_11855 [Lysobacter zhanggongensis]|uniref:Uncharacterized protein n=1 Tax=Lysobacter zhanggongensis TaxID=1774951 RepID=A0ABU7YTA6_9GAMM